MMKNPKGRIEPSAVRVSSVREFHHEVELKRLKIGDLVTVPRAVALALRAKKLVEFL